MTKNESQERKRLDSGYRIGDRFIEQGSVKVEDLMRNLRKAEKKSGK